VQRAALYVVTGCVVVAATAFLTVYAALTAFTGDDWPDL
jgi:hypothetical protein